MHRRARHSQPRFHEKNNGGLDLLLPIPKWMSRDTRFHKKRNDILTDKETCPLSSWQRVACRQLCHQDMEDGGLVGWRRRQEGSWSEDVRLVRRNVLDVCRNSTIADCLLHLPDLFCRPVVNSDSMKSDGSQPPGRGGFFRQLPPEMTWRLITVTLVQICDQCLWITLAGHESCCPQSCGKWNWWLPTTFPRRDGALNVKHSVLLQGFESFKGAFDKTSRCCKCSFVCVSTINIKRQKSGCNFYTLRTWCMLVQVERENIF